MASAEIYLTREILYPLVSLVVEPGVLVAGAALPGHNYVPGWSGLADGTQVPWNTVAAWGPGVFPFGFPPVSDLKGSGGVEEWAAIWFAQKVLGVENAQAFLLGIPGISWDTDFGGDEKRKEAHRKKMASKISRPQSQMDYILALMGLRGRSAPWMAPWVSHL